MLWYPYLFIISFMVRLEKSLIERMDLLLSNSDLLCRPCPRINYFLTKNTMGPIYDSNCRSVIYKVVTAMHLLHAPCTMPATRPNSCRFFPLPVVSTNPMRARYEYTSQIIYNGHGNYYLGRDMRPTDFGCFVIEVAVSSSVQAPLGIRTSICSTWFVSTAVGVE